MRCFYRMAVLASVFGIIQAPIPIRADSVFVQTNLVTDDQSVNHAVLTDLNLKNAWGISSSPTSPFWVSNNGTGTSTLYGVNPLTNFPTKQALTVSIPGDGSVTGQVFNGGTGFNADRFLFVSEDGTISGWRGALGTVAEILQSPDPTTVYKGAATATIGLNSYLYSANFSAGKIDVLKGSSGAPDLTGSFLDPNLPAGYAPFNIQNLGGKLYVTYALQDGAKHDDVAGAGHGIVDAFDLQGNLLTRIATQGVLNSPWGLAIAPIGFGEYGGDLLVGNFGDGRINAFDPNGLGQVGTLSVDPFGTPLEIDGLWGLRFGSGAGNGGNADLLYFSAGPNDETNGLFGSIAAVPAPGSALLFLVGGLSGLFTRRFWGISKA